MFYFIIWAIIRSWLDMKLRVIYFLSIGLVFAFKQSNNRGAYFKQYRIRCCCENYWMHFIVMPIFSPMFCSLAKPYKYVQYIASLIGATRNFVCNLMRITVFIYYNNGCQFHLRQYNTSIHNKEKINSCIFCFCLVPQS